MADLHAARAVTTETAIGSTLSWLQAIQYPEWMAEAVCTPDDKVWFPSATSGLKHDRRLALASSTAAKICAECPVRVECLEYALETGEQHGVWGGLNPIERRELMTRRPLR